MTISLGKYLIADGFYAKSPGIIGGVPKHIDKKHCVHTLKTLKPYIGKRVEFFIKVEGK